jgi:ubiquinone/menaquinone biosynthesis C-methylase UbiE
VSVQDQRSGLESDGREGLRAQLHAMWSGVAAAWESNVAFIDARGAQVTERMLELTRPQPGERVLELGCGPGGPGLDAARLVAPEGEVVLSDVAPEMTSIASARAGALGLTNVTTRVLDLERIDEPDDSYDVVLCREGLMLVPDPVRAAAEIRRVLRPGGRVALTVWGPRARNPWLEVVFDSVSEQLGTPTPPPGVPHPFSLDDAGRLAGVLAEGGLGDLAVTELATPYQAASVEEWWARTSALAGPLARKLAALPDPAADALRARAAQAIRRYQTPTGLEIPGVCLIGATAAGFVRDGLVPIEEQPPR